MTPFAPPYWVAAQCYQLQLMWELHLSCERYSASCLSWLVESHLLYEGIGAAGDMRARVMACVSRLAPTRVREGPGSLLPALPIRWQARQPDRSRICAPGISRLGMDASAKPFVAVDRVLEVSPTLVGDRFEPQPARVVASMIVTIQLAVHRGVRTTGALRDGRRRAPLRTRRCTGRTQNC